MSHVSLQEFLKTEPDGTLEAIAEQYNTTLLEGSEKSALSDGRVRR